MAIKGITRIEFISAGFKSILESDGCKTLVESVATDIQARANANVQEESAGFKTESILGGYGGGRYVAFVSSADQAAARAESEDKALSKAVMG